MKQPVKHMRIKELEQPVNSIRQNIVDKWLDDKEGTMYLIFSMYGVEGIRKIFSQFCGVNNGIKAKT